MCLEQLKEWRSRLLSLCLFHGTSGHLFMIANYSSPWRMAHEGFWAGFGTCSREHIGIRIHGNIKILENSEVERWWTLRPLCAENMVSVWWSHMLAYVILYLQTCMPRNSHVGKAWFYANTVVKGPREPCTPAGFTLCSERRSEMGCVHYIWNQERDMYWCATSHRSRAQGHSKNIRERWTGKSVP